MNNYRFEINRRSTRELKIGGLALGGENPVRVQSMTNTDTGDREKTLAQVRELVDAGCEIVRIAVPDAEAVKTIPYIKDNIDVPLVADIHFDYKLALESIIAGCDKIRINPGNIGSSKKVEKIIEAAGEKNIAIRVGVNSGSLERELLEKYGEPSSEALAESAVNHVKTIEKMGYHNIVVSVKSSDLVKTIEANRILSREIDYPLHLGVTEAGDALSGATKSSAALGILLSEGIGDTIRISLTADPVIEVKVAFELLRFLKMRNVGIEYISCPTCGRTRVDVEATLSRVKEKLADIKEPLKIAVMGCAVNGPGEAREADIGLAGGKEEFLIFARGKVIKKVPESEAVDELVELVRQLTGK